MWRISVLESYWILAVISPTLVITALYLAKALAISRQASVNEDIPGKCSNSLRTYINSFPITDWMLFYFLEMLVTNVSIIVILIITISCFSSIFSVVLGQPSNWSSSSCWIFCASSSRSLPGTGSAQVDEICSLDKPIICCVEVSQRSRKSRQTLGKAPFPQQSN